MSNNDDTHHTSTQADKNVGIALFRTRAFAWLAMVWESLWPLILPFVLVLAAFLTVSWLGLWPTMSEPLRLALLALFTVAALASLWPLQHMRFPSRAQLDTRIEHSSALQHRPVTAQNDSLATSDDGDTPASDDPFAQALWQEHRRRMANRLSNLKPGLPVPKIAQKDPYGFRALSILLLFVGLFAGWGQLGPRIGDAFRSHETVAQATGRIDAWVSPPAYTNRPPLFLSRIGSEAEIKVPEGSTVVVRVLDLENPSLALKQGEDETAIEVSDETVKTPVNRLKDTKQAASQTFTFKLEESANMVLRSGETQQAQWPFTVLPDENPRISFLETPSAATRGALEFSFKVSDDYGVRTARAELVQMEDNGTQADPLIPAPEVNLPLPRQRAREGTAKASQDLTTHPWAGAKVAMTLIATDDAEQEGRSEPETFTLPERVFVKPLAQALVFERRRLAMDAKKARDVAEMINIITTTHPEEFIKNITHYTALRVIYRSISRAENHDQLRESLEMMWETALAIEDGGLSQAERRLRDAQERLSKALENGASDEEISKLMQELRQAMSEFMEELQRQMARNNQNQQAMPLNENTQVLRQQDLEKMMQQIEDLAKSGSKDAARQLLQELQQMMNNLQTAQPSQQQQQQNDQFSKQMDKLGEMMRQQQQLMDETFKMQRQQRQMQQNGQRQQQGQQQQQGQNGQRQQQQGQQGEQQQGEGQQPMTAEELAEAMKQLQQRQGELQKQMQEMQQALKELGMEPGQLGEAGEAMGNAEQELGEGQTGPATGEQGRALQAMRQGAQQMMQNMQNQAGEQGRRGERGQHGQQSRGERDPLGRETRNQGPQIGQDTKVPGEIDAQRAREILNAIRRKLGETTRPKLELDYLDRLLPTR